MHQWGPHSADNSNSEKPTQHACDALCSSGRGVGLPILVPGAMLKCDECTVFSILCSFLHFWQFSTLIRTITVFLRLFALFTSFRTVLHYLDYRNQLNIGKY